MLVTVPIPDTMFAIIVLLIVTVGCFYIGGFVTMSLAALIKPDLEIGILFFGFWGAVISGAVGFYFALDFVLGVT